MNDARILVVEDEEHLATGLRFNLEAEGYQVEIAPDGRTALDQLLGGESSFDLVILDVMLPDKDGFEVAKELREAGKYVPVLMLTARGRPEDVLLGFEAGADDYLPKPFELSILLARLHGLLRRRVWFDQSQPQPAQEADTKKELYSFDGKTVDFAAQELQAHGRVVQLTLMEADLLRYLISHAGRPVSRKEILEDVWNLHVDTDTRAIDNFIVRLRRYVEEDPAKPKHLLTVRSIGYRFIPEPEA
jgi:DNA-binding response OmpR family regulator